MLEKQEDAYIERKIKCTVFCLFVCFPDLESVGYRKLWENRRAVRLKKGNRKQAYVFFKNVKGSLLQLRRRLKQVV